MESFRNYVKNQSASFVSFFRKRNFFNKTWNHFGSDSTTNWFEINFSKNWKIKHLKFYRIWIRINEDQANKQRNKLFSMTDLIKIAIIECFIEKSFFGLCFDFKIYSSNIKKIFYEIFNFWITKLPAQTTNA